MFSYTVDAVTTNVARSGSGTFAVPTITMSAAHSVGDAARTQYFLTVTGGNGVVYGTASPTGDNWYDAGMSTTVSSNWVWNTIVGQSRTAITNWQLDSVNQNPSRQGSGTLTTLSVIMSASHSVNFVSTTQYYLTVSGGNGVAYGTASPTSDNWYDSGSSTTVSSNWVWNTVAGQSRTAVTNWQLDTVNQNPVRQGSGTLTTSSVSMSTYHTVNFVSVTQYYLTVSGGNGITYGTPSSTGDNWYDSGTSTTVSSNWVWGVTPGQSRTAINNYAVDGANQNPSRSRFRYLNNINHFNDNIPCSCFLIPNTVLPDSNRRELSHVWDRVSNL